MNEYIYRMQKNTLEKHGKCSILNEPCHSDAPSWGGGEAIAKLFPLYIDKRVINSCMILYEQCPSDAPS